MQGTATQAPEWVEIAPLVISALSLLIGGVLGGGGYAALRVSRRQIEEERRNYWKRERQLLYTNALQRISELTRGCEEIVTMLRNEDPLDEIATAVEKQGELHRRFDDVFSGITLMSNEETRVNVQNLLITAYFVPMMVRSTMTAEREPDLEYFNNLTKKILSMSQKVENAFRRELGIAPLDHTALSDELGEAVVEMSDYYDTLGPQSDRDT